MHYYLNIFKNNTATNWTLNDGDAPAILKKINIYFVALYTVSEKKTFGRQLHDRERNRKNCLERQAI